jgi:hypothetical protein
VRQQRPNLTVATLAAGILLAAVLAVPLAGAASGSRTGRPAGAEPSAKVVLDGVALVVRSSALPAAAFVASKPGDPIQGAASVSQSPYRELLIYAYPFGSSAPSEGIETVEPGHLRAYRAIGAAGHLLVSARPSALVFGQHVTGSVRVIQIGLGSRQQATEVVSWLADAAGRLWIVRAAAPLPGSARAVAAFAEGTSVSAGAVARATTVPRSELVEGGSARLPSRANAVTTQAGDPPPVRFPPWWSGDCDVNNDPQSFPLSSWDGLTACGPGPNRGGVDVAVDFFPGAWGELEWECVELSMRWLYLAYGVHPYPANGSQVVADYSRSDGGDLSQIANDGSSVPLPGDVLSMEPTSANGHTAVVTGTNVTHGNGSINILEQNMNGGNGTNTLSVVDNVVEPDYGMPVTEWLQSPEAAKEVGGGVPSSDGADLVRDGGFNRGDGGGWRTVRGSHFATMPAGKIATRPFEGNGFGVTSTGVAGGGIYQDISFPVSAGESFCADAEVVTAGNRASARGNLTLWLLGSSARQASRVSFGPLPGGNRWRSISTCVTATGPRSVIRVQFYDAPGTPTLAVDAVDVHQSLVENGGFNFSDGGIWRKARHSRFAIIAARKVGTRPYEGNGFGVTSTSVKGGGIYQNIALAVRAGQSFCADAEVVTAGSRTHARGSLTLWLLGASGNQSSTVGFGPLAGASKWVPVSTCVTATGAHSYIRVQFYDVAKSPTLAIDAVDVHRSLIENGGFNHDDGGHWQTGRGAHFATMPAGKILTRPYEGNGFGVTNSAAPGGGVYQVIPLSISAGESFCADAEVVTAGTSSKARGTMSVLLAGLSGTQSSTVAFGPLPGGNRWTHIVACVTATRAHSGIRVELREAPGAPTLAIDAVDVR